MTLTLTLALERSSTMSKTVFKCDECGTVFDEEPKECCIIEEATEDYEAEYSTFTSIEVEPKVQALMQHLGIEDPEEIEEESDEESDEEYKYGRQVYLVLTDDEADDEFDRQMDNYIDDCVLGELPQRYRNYFDSESFKADVKSMDGRGPQLASYDGEENEEQVEGEWYYIYRVN